MTYQLIRRTHRRSIRAICYAFLCIMTIAGSAEGYTLLDFPSDASVQGGGYKFWNLDSDSPQSLTLSYAIESELLSGLGGAWDAAESAIGSWDAVSPIINFLDAGYEPVVNSQQNWADGVYVMEGPAGAGIGANIDIMSRPGDFEFEFLGRPYNFGDNSLAFAVPIVMSGTIRSVDIYLNSDYTWAADGNHFDVQSVVLHELGHALGLDHPNQAGVGNQAQNYYPWTNLPGKPSSEGDLMHSTYFPDGINRTLGGDEAGGLAFIYGLTPGDANLDNIVDLTDLTAVSANWGAQTDWSGGDFDWDGTVDITDLTLLAANWNIGGGQIPEPATLSLLSLALVAIVGRKRT